ncbi:GIY-YIG nuclease family protein [Verrucosispora sp. NA02020]|uniref:GIY-YIG nuclease family protein n=1 Tax=Verrucosispora sp. NA02020 TaxID=2742132 RepID=UPI0015901667|nr:GIY-YIG nuclease family protein [Verrucosispora sp. NA02020]QKW15450.1 GIY-YIG nuclease family protein [Verrucosispora sp. NA02020]
MTIASPIRGPRRITDRGAVRYFAPDASTYVYRFFREDGRLLYVGVAFDPEDRWRAHRHKNWWAQVADSRLDLFPSRRLALQEEARAIAEENPIHNHRPPARQMGHREFARLTVSAGGRVIALDPRGVEISRTTATPDGLARLDAALGRVS